jgi:hypothetical protein
LWALDVGDIGLTVVNRAHFTLFSL